LGGPGRGQPSWRGSGLKIWQPGKKIELVSSQKWGRGGLDDGKNYQGGYLGEGCVGEEGLSCSRGKQSLDCPTAKELFTEGKTCKKFRKGVGQRGSDERGGQVENVGGKWIRGKRKRGNRNGVRAWGLKRNRGKGERQRKQILKWAGRLAEAVSFTNKGRFPNQN